MLEEEIIEQFKCRNLNTKTNNYIFCNIDDFDFISGIPNRCSISTLDDNIDICCAQNIKINLAGIDVKDILSYTLKVLKETLFLDESLDYTLEFKNKFDLFRFQSILSNHNVIVQLIFYNVESLFLQQQMLFNEMYYFNSLSFNVNSFIKGDNFESYFLSNGRVLDSRENYTKVIKFKDNKITDEDFKELGIEKTKIYLKI